MTHQTHTEHGRRPAPAHRDRWIEAAAALVIAAAIGATAPRLGAEPTVDEERLAELLKVKIRTVQHLALNPTMVRAVRRQNDEPLDEKEIARRDEEWQASKELTQVKWTLQQNEAGRFLRSNVDRNAFFNEAFLTDKRGANVAAFPPTSDYFQGDEEKWSESFNGGEGRVFVGPLEYDESSGAHAVQISAPVIDGGATIGVLIVGVTVDYLESRNDAAN